MYYNRGSHPSEVICDDCGTIRWGDPYEDDGSAAFNARYEDKSGDWCWDRVWSLPPRPPRACDDCGKPVDGWARAATA